MKAMIHSQYGSPDVLRFGQTERPQPADDEVLIRVMSASVNPLDWHFLTGTPYFIRVAGGLRSPRNPIPGADVAGVVEAAGSRVTGFEPGQRVFGAAKGSFAEYVVAKDDRVAVIPSNVSFDQAAAVPVAAVTALQGLRDAGGLVAGQHVLINGASGGVGTFAVQIAKALRAEVTGVCSTRNIDQARSLGADHIIDYTTDDFATEVETYDLVIDGVGNRSLADYRGVMKPGGRLVLIGGSKNVWVGPLPKIVAMRLSSLFSSKKMASMIAAVTADDLRQLAGMMERGQIRSVVDRHYDLADAAAALHHQGRFHSQGKILINVSSGDG